MTTLAPTDFTVTVEIETYHECEEGDEENTPWCRVVTVTATAPGFSAKVGSATAYILDRLTMSAVGLPEQDIKAVSESTAALFDDPIFFDDICMGTNLLFHEVLVSPQSRRLGLGRKIVDAVLQKTREQIELPYYALAAPGFLRTEVEREAAQEGVSSFDDRAQMIVDRQQDAAGEFWSASEFILTRPSGGDSLFFNRFFTLR